MNDWVGRDVIVAWKPDPGRWCGVIRGSARKLSCRSFVVDGLFQPPAYKASLRRPHPQVPPNPPQVDLAEGHRDQIRLDHSCAQQLTRELKQAPDERGLAYLISIHYEGLNSIHINTALGRLQQMPLGPQASGTRHFIITQLLVRSETCLLYPQPYKLAGRNEVALYGLGPAFGKDLQHLSDLRTHVSQLVKMLVAFMSLGYPPGFEWLQMFLFTVRPHLKSFNPRQLGNIMWALGKAQHKVYDAWLETFLQAVLKGLPTFSPKDYVITAWGLATLRRSLPQSWLDQFVKGGRLEHFKARDFAQLMWALGRLGWPVNSQWLTLYFHAAQHQLVFFSPRDVAHVLWAMVKLKIRPPPTWLAQLLHNLVSSNVKLMSMKPVDQAVILWALGALKFQPGSQWMQAVLSTSAEGLMRYSGHDFSNTLWALVQLKVRPGREWSVALSAALARKDVDWDDQSLSTVFWSLSRLHVLHKDRREDDRDPQEHQDVRNHLLDCSTRIKHYLMRHRDLTRLGLQAVCLVLHALVTLDDLKRPASNRVLLARLASCLDSLVNHAPRNSLVVLLWLCVRLKQHPPPAWMGLAMARLQGALSSLSSSELTLTIWCLMKLHYSPDHHWWWEMTEVLKRIPDRLSPVQVGVVFVGVATLRPCDYPELFTSWYPTLQSHLELMNLTSLNTLLLSLHKVGDCRRIPGVEDMMAKVGGVLERRCTPEVLRQTSSKQLIFLLENTVALQVPVSPPCLWSVLHTMQTRVRWLTYKEKMSLARAVKYFAMYRILTKEEEGREMLDRLQSVCPPFVT